MADEHPIQGLMTTAMENLKDMIEVNTIIGDPVESPDGSVIIPVSKLGFGFAAGGSEFNGSDSESDSGSGDTMPFGGGSGGGVSITPVAFLIVSPKGIKMIHMDENTHIYEKILNVAPQAIEKIQQILNESNQLNKQKQSSEEGQGKQRQEKQKQQQKREKDDQKNNQDQQSDDDDFDQSYDI